MTPMSGCLQALEAHAELSRASQGHKHEKGRQSALQDTGNLGSELAISIS
jgi:hypothetical protein